VNISWAHASADRKCPDFVRQKAIQELRVCPFLIPERRSSHTNPLGVPVVRNSCSTPGLYQRRNSDYGFSESSVAPRTTVPTQSEVSTQNKGLPTPAVPNMKLGACPPPPLLWVSPANHEVPGHITTRFTISVRHTQIAMRNDHCTHRSQSAPDTSDCTLILQPYREPNVEDDWSGHLSRWRSIVSPSLANSPSPTIIDVLNWNLNGLRTRLPDLQASGRDPAIFCLHETHLHPSHALRLRGCTINRYAHTASERATGGTASAVPRCALASAHAPVRLVQ
jgi:hypothetical protein